MSFISHFHNVVYFGYGQKIDALIVPNNTNSVNIIVYIVHALFWTPMYIVMHMLLQFKGLLYTKYYVYKQKNDLCIEKQN
jgi:hypothetical protein